ncbi:bifunctional phosphoribosylaminoimidazolecarboxamide formyltransferase/IMP cyclohydrolase [Candidatus Thorarchaeota archaeon]|nr:MAG: bifunctional phosphoribosylaminoimidazolecarboxamide formyltransferase/IMP cyclohydrolase [Candidatus Thorarchaeota archaeon]
MTMVCKLMRRLGLISVYDKTGIVEFCKSISSHFDFISTGKTADLLLSSEVPVRPVSDFTKFPEILDGRVKTLHPVLLGGILGMKDQHKEMGSLDILPIGLVVVNLYPFEEVISKTHSERDALENIDIGGVTLLRAAAKNYPEVIVVPSPQDYGEISTAIQNDEVTLELRKELAKKAFLYTTKYDAAISQYFSKSEKMPTNFVLAFDNPQDLRYGENWHQQARYYLELGKTPFYKQVHGKDISYNNLVDFYAALGTLSEHESPSCAIIKHTSPCGFASANDIETAFEHAFETDTLSAYGSVMGFNRRITKALALKLSAMFVDAIIAPDYDSKALEILKKKSKLILCTIDQFDIPRLSFRSIPNGLLVQTTDSRVINELDTTTVSKRKPSSQEFKDLLFAWKIVKYVKSNAAVVSKNTQTLGVGMGQASRIGAVELALRKAGERSNGAVMASDAFFPYRDSIDAAVERGITAIIAPGGSIRDSESIIAADESGIALVWSNLRAFLH